MDRSSATERLEVPDILSLCILLCTRLALWLIQTIVKTLLRRRLPPHRSDRSQSISLRNAQKRLDSSLPSSIEQRS